jgi:hypothetical protein
MRLDGSCQCGGVRFHVESDTPYPFMICYCSICRKTSGAVTSNVMGQRDTLKVSGKRLLKVHHAVMRANGKRPTRSSAERWFCGRCGSHLYLLDDRWPEGVWPNAAAIDTPLPVPPEHVQIMLRYKPDWVPMIEDDPGSRHQVYPRFSIAGWHEAHADELKTQPTKARSKASRGAAGTG